MMSFPTQHTIKHNSVDFKFGGNVNYFEKKKRNPVQSQTLRFIKKIVRVKNVFQEFLF